MATISSSLKPSCHEEYFLRECKKCSFVTLAPVPDNQILTKHYNSDYWQGENLHVPKYLNLFFALRMNSVVRELTKFAPANAHILDWGAGDGSFVRLLNKKGFDCLGIDSYSFACDEEKILTADIQSTPFPSQYFDCITSFHVLEHLKDPVNSVKAAFDLIKPGGIFICEVPNINSFQYQLFGEKWHAVDVPFHLNHFNPYTLSKLFMDNVNGKIIKKSFFSHRHSSSALLLSILPFFSPKLVRKKYGGRYPFFLQILYLLFQLVVYPIALTEAHCKRGAVIRLYIRKY